MCGAIVGAVLGAGGLCAVRDSTGDWAELALCFLSAPMLLVVVICSFDIVVAGFAMGLGCAFLYALYALVLFSRRGWRRRAVWLFVIVSVHGFSLCAFAHIMSSIVLQSVP